MSASRVPTAVPALLARRLGACTHRPASLRVTHEVDGWTVRAMDEVGRPAVWVLSVAGEHLQAVPVLVDATPDAAAWSEALEAALPELAALPGVLRRVARARMA